MQIQLNTDNNLVGSEDLAAQVEADVRAALDRFSWRITRVEVHLTDQNSEQKGGTDMRCMMEARVAGRQPMSVSHGAATVALAIDGAADKLTHALETIFGKLDADRRSGARQANNDTT
jgi:hypothetical protein